MNVERVFVAAGLLLLPTLWLQSLLHQAPRFAGSLAGGVLGIVAALLMLVPLAYSVVKRLPKATFLSRPALLRLHVYTTSAGALLAVVHSGHRVRSALGLVLVAMMLLCVLSGFVGRHYLGYVAMELRERKSAAARMQREFDIIAAGVADAPGNNALRAAAAEAAEALSELEYSVQADDWIRGRLRAWLVVHIASSVLFYVLLAAHITAAFQYGLRWLPLW